RLAWGVGGALAAVLLLALAAPRLLAPGPDARPIASAHRPEPAGPAAIDKVRIGAKTFTEQYILAAVIDERLRMVGLETERAESLGSTVVFDALKSSDVDVYVDYSGTVWANYMKQTETPPRWRVLDEVEAWLAREHGVRSLGSLGFENAYALAVRKDTAAELGLRSIGDLSEHAGRLTMGADYEFFGRPEWKSIRSGYRLGFADNKSMDSTLMYEALAAGDVDVISAFSSDGRIAEYQLVVLDDPLGVIPPYDALVLLSPRVANDRRVVEALSPLLGAIEVATMRSANLMVDRQADKRTANEAALWLLEQAAIEAERPR
ncbi:MAG: ABC transporter permease, partial [Deltaproteobacteria bacterium]|nr:ABC transporter permease [Deltaproteobacteria bacterium]